MTQIVYKILTGAEWRQAEMLGCFEGSAADRRDGYIHFSTAAQVEETACRHFAGAADLVLAAVGTAALGDALRWEAARGGSLFPHLYAALPVSAVLWAIPLLWDGERHRFPRLEP